MHEVNINNKIITIDGPSASGKGTLAKRLANLLKYKYLDSGALYRLCAYIHDLYQYTMEEPDILAAMNFIKNSHIEFTNNQIIINQQNIEPKLRSEHIGNLASKLAAIDIVRSNLLEWQRSFATTQGLVTDGRDMGTVVFPSATYKIFLIADVNKRALRRYQQLIEQNLPANFDNILHDLQQRDARDEQRVNAPLKPAVGAYILDNSDLTIEESINIIKHEVLKIS